jgi:type II secretory pathway pseudopilin PulG
MKRLPRALPGSLALLALVAAGACSPPPPPTPQARANQQTMAACRQRADQVYAEQNRGAGYESDNRASPFSSSYVPGITTRGLGERYSRDTMISDCVRNAGSDVDRGAGPVMEPTTH